MAKTAITPTRAEDFAQWYQAVIDGAQMAEDSPVRGSMVILPWGYAIWEKIQSALDKKLKETGHVNAYFPLLIPLSFLEKEADHVEGFAKECAVVTHHRLESKDGKLIPSPDAKLEEPFVIRPTSETIIGESFSRWVQSYRDLPILVNQWANVMRWEMRTRKFLRTSEFLWQEGHTVHATHEEAMEETMKMQGVYADIMENYLASPGFRGEKTPEERFAGAVQTFTIENVMQDKKALQSNTSHYLGQNFAKASNIQFTNAQGERQYAFTTSWGFTTRVIGGLIMTHADDDGLVLPPRIAPKHVVILPMLGKNSDEEILAYCKNIQKQIESFDFYDEKVQVQIDTSLKPHGQKYWDWVRKGIPIRIEIGPRDMEQNGYTISLRSASADQKQFVSMNDLKNIPDMLYEMQKNLFLKAQEFKNNSLTEVSSLAEFTNHFQDDNAGFALCYSHPDIQPEREQLVKELKISARCIPVEYNQNNPESICIFSGKPTTTKIIYARSY